jgi:ribonuclease P protein component
VSGTAGLAAQAWIWRDIRGVKREADLSTEQAGAQASAWVSRPHGNGRGPQSDCRPPRARPQASVGLSAPDAARRLTRERTIASTQARLARLTKRAEFVNAAKGRRVHAASFALQSIRRPADTAAPRFGFTVTKKLGNSVVRNRIRRRLREALRNLPDLSAHPGYDYVIVARQAALNQAFPALQEELARAFAEIHAARPGGVAKPRRFATATEKKTKD